MVAEPAQIPGILAIFEMGGVSSQEGMIGREISWHRMRLASDNAFGGNSTVDLVVTAILLLRRFQVVIVQKIRRIFSNPER